MTAKLIGKRIVAVMLGVILCCSGIMLTACSSETYQPKKKTPTISSPDIGKDGVLVVGVDANSSPFAGTTSSSGIVGINVDVAAAIADELGLKLEIVDYGSDPAKALSSGAVDIVIGVDANNTTNRFWTSEPYIESAVALFSTNANDTIPAAKKAKIAAQTSSMSAWEVNKQFGEESLVSSDSLKTAYADLVSGTVDYVAADAVIGTFAANQDDVDVTIVGLLQKPSGYSIGVEDDNAVLKQAVSDALAKLSDDGSIGLIEKKWLGALIDLSDVELSASVKALNTADKAKEEEVASEDASTGNTAADGGSPASDDSDTTRSGTDTSDASTFADTDDELLTDDEL